MLYAFPKRQHSNISFISSFFLLFLPENIKRKEEEDDTKEMRWDEMRKCDQVARSVTTYEQEEEEEGRLFTAPSKTNPLLSFFLLLRLSDGKKMGERREEELRFFSSPFCLLFLLAIS